MGSIKFKYLSSDNSSSLWGVSVDTVGKTSIEAGFDSYPPKDRHPKEYYFEIEKGRILNNYQIIYITKGKGYVWFSRKEDPVTLESGTVMIIPPPHMAQLLS